jgi:hypothetical protein
LGQLVLLAWVAGVLLAGCSPGSTDLDSPTPGAAPPGPAAPAPIEVHTGTGAVRSLDRWADLAAAVRQSNGVPLAIRLAPGTHRVTEPLVLPSGSSVTGAGRGVTHLTAAAQLPNLVTNADHESGNSGITVQGLTIDCARRAEEGLFAVRVSRLRLAGLEATGCRHTGIRVSGKGVVTRDVVLDAITVARNGGDGLAVRWASRGVRYTNVLAEGNGRDGVVLDHSEGAAANVLSNENGRDGIVIRNVFAFNASNLLATRNGRHGIYVQGLVASAGTGWNAQGNSVRNPGLFDEVHFSGDDTLSYGITRDSAVFGLVTGAHADGFGPPTARHGLFVDAGIRQLRLEGIIALPVRQEPAMMYGESDLRTE